MNHAMIMMGGTGSRFGASIPKQFVEVDGRPIFTYLLEAYESFEMADDIFIVCHEEWTDFTTQWAQKLGIKKLQCVTAGGSSRSHSIQKGLAVITRQASGDDVVLIHDITHPFIDKTNVTQCIQCAFETGAATLAGSCFDTMYLLDETDVIDHVAPRERLVSATAPECFRLDVILPLYEGKSPQELEKMTSAGAMLVANGQTVKVIRTPLINLKITLHEDMEAFKHLLHGYYYD